MAVDALLALVALSALVAWSASLALNTCPVPPGNTNSDLSISPVGVPPPPPEAEIVTDLLVAFGVNVTFEPATSSIVSSPLASIVTEPTLTCP